MVQAPEVQGLGELGLAELLDVLAKYWVLIIGSGGIIVWLTKMQQGQDVMKERLGKIERRMDNSEDKFDALKNDFQEIKTDVRWIRETMERQGK